MENKLDLIKLLEHIDPSMCDYQEWVNVGMALKYEGYTAADWEDWSKWMVHVTILENNKQDYCPFLSK